MTDRFPRDRSLRRHAARGTLVNAGFSIGLSALTLVRGFVLAIFLSRADYGLWGILIITLGTIATLTQVGIGDRFIAQDEDDQERAWQTAFTLELALAGAMTVTLLALMPVVVAVYGREELLLPGLALVTIVPAGALQAPLWIHYRRMAFVRQRLLQSIDPVLGLVVAVALAAAGAGYWALVGGFVVGAWATSVAALVTCPYRLRLRREPGALRRYASFSWPLFVVAVAGLLTAQGAVLATEAAVGVAGVGAITLAAQIAQFADRVDGVVTGTLYPAICAVRDRTELLRESFVKSNRFALIWAMPFGIGLALFAPDLVAFVIGEEWRPAVLVLQVYGVAAACRQVGFNWSAYYRARGETRPLAVSAVAGVVVFLAVAIPGVFTIGLEGIAVGIAAQTAALLAVRTVYLRRLFDGFAILAQAARAVAPVVPAAAAVGLARLLEPAERTAGLAAAELVLFVVVAAVATWAFERPLLREAAGYLRRVAPAPAYADPSSSR